MADTNVGVIAVLTNYSGDYSTWKSYVQYVSAVLPTSVTTTQFGSDSSTPDLVAMTAAIADDLGVTTAEVIYVSPSTV